MTLTKDLIPAVSILIMTLSGYRRWFPLDPSFVKTPMGWYDDRFDFDSDNDGIPDHRDQFHRILMPVQMVMVTGYLIIRIQMKTDGFPDDQLSYQCPYSNQPGVEAPIDKRKGYPFTSVRGYAPNGSIVFSQTIIKTSGQTNIRTELLYPQDRTTTE